MTEEQQPKPMDDQGKYSELDELHDLVPYPRPEGDINLFYRSHNRDHEVMIGGEDNDWDTYCIGYRRAAAVLVNQITRKDSQSLRRDYSRDWESQAYATIFLYRQYLELRLKELILAYGGDFSEINNEHSLLKLWGTLRKQECVQSEIPEPDTKDIETAEKIIEQFDQIDERSQAFRYPLDKAGLRVTVDPMQFDLVHLKELLGWTSQFLDAWSACVYEYLHASP